MAALFFGKRGIIKIYRASLRDYNTLQSSRCFAAQESEGTGKSSDTMNEARQEAMGTTTDAKAPNVTLSHAADTTKEGLKRATDIANTESGDASRPQKNKEDAGTAAAATVAGGEDESEANVAVGEMGTVKGQNQSSG